jgi:hypothetical protein
MQSTLTTYSIASNSFARLFFLITSTAVFESFVDQTDSSTIYQHLRGPHQRSIPNGSRMNTLSLKLESNFKNMYR